MCGRYAITTPAKKLAEYFGVLPPHEAYLVTDDARPSENLPVVLASEPKQMVIGHWGYPAEIKGRKKELVNIRAESILGKPYFRKAVENHRCIILADGFYEWRTKTLSDAMRPFFSIITVPANKTMSPIHDRMPAILPPGREKEWIAPHGQFELLVPYRDELTVKPAE
jgi:putative SOS response-associated peptidase YedK